MGRVFNHPPSGKITVQKDSGGLVWTSDGRPVNLLPDAAAIVLSTPEYHGSYSSVIKMTIEHLGFPSALAGKPVLLVGVAAGVIGAIKATEHLRSVASHVGANVLPGAVSVANVQKAFDADGTLKDPAVEKRLRAAGRSLIDYLEQNVCPRLALEQMVRENSGESE